MKKLLVLTVIIALGVIIWLAITPREVDVAPAYRYQIDDITQIGRIEISESGKETIKLVRQMNIPDPFAPHAWRLNDRYHARQNAIENLLKAIINLQLKFIPQAAGVETIKDILRENRVAVNIYDHSNKLMMGYVLGGVTPDERGTYIEMAGTEMPAVVSLGGLDGSLMPRYQMPLKDWRDRTVIAANYDEIRFAYLHYPAQPEASFQLNYQEDSWSLSSLQGENNEIVQRGAIEAFLREFQQLGAEDIILDKSLLGKLQGQSSFLDLELGTTTDTVRISFYPVQRDSDGPASAQISRFHVVDHEDNIFLTQYRVFEKIFWGYHHFIEKN